MQHSKIISGIDIGTSKITTIIGQYFDNEKRLNIVAVSSQAAQGFRKGQIVNLEEATQTITNCIESAERMAGFPIKTATIAIASTHLESINSQGVVSVNHPNGEISTEDIYRSLDAAKAITLPSGKEIIHIIPKGYSVDGQAGIVDPVGMNGVRLEVSAHIIIASTPALKNLDKCLDEVGINPVSIIYSGLAAATCALTPTEKELGVALIDIGGSITTITIYSEGSPAFSAVIPIGANNVTNDLAIGLRLNLEDAQTLKIKLSQNKLNDNFKDEIDLPQIGIISDDSKKVSFQTAVNGIIKPRLEEIFNLVYQQIKQSGLATSIPAGIVLTGGGSQTISAKDICSKIIPLPLRIAAPPKVGGIVDEIINPSYTSSIGLIMYSLEESKKQNPPQKKNKNPAGHLFGRLKSFLEPLLP